MQDKLNQLIALLKLSYALSDESERINNPKRNEDKYTVYCKCIEKCYTLTKSIKGKLEFTDPDFPCGFHMIEIVLPTANQDLNITEIKNDLADVLKSIPDANLYVDKVENVHIYMGIEDVYTPRETQ